MLIYLVAGEASGDALGARLMKALRDLSGGEVSFTGIGGPEMVAQGLESLFPMTELAVMGLVEVIPRVPLLIRRLRQTAQDVARRKPDLLITIDSPDFAYRLASRISDETLLCVHYVAPSVWAWRPRRVHTFRRYFDHVLALLPFEPHYFEAAGLPCTHVGHPVVESGLDGGDGLGFRLRHNIDQDQPLLAVLPGSRVGEVRRILPIFLNAISELHRHREDLHVVVTTVPAVDDSVKAADWPVPTTIVDGREKADAFAASDAAIAASGTVTLELALADVPHLIAYRTNPLTALIIRALVRVPFANLINLVLGRQSVPELLQQNCTSDLVAHEAARLLGDETVRAQQRLDFAKAMDALGRGGSSPSRRAAEIVLQWLGAEVASDIAG